MLQPAMEIHVSSFIRNHVGFILLMVSGQNEFLFLKLVDNSRDVILSFNL